jgi:hypothetical protein
MMQEPTYVITMNVNRIACDAWIEERRRPDGDYDLIGMGRHREYDANTGELVADKTDPTGVTGWAPHAAIEQRRPSLWQRVFGAA